MLRRNYLVVDYMYCLFKSAGKQKQGKANSRKSKSPNLGQAYAGGERPSSVSSVHSDGDYHRPTQPQWSWDERPSSTGELPILQRHYLDVLERGKITHLKTVFDALLLLLLSKVPCSFLTTRLPCAC